MSLRFIRSRVAGAVAAVLAIFFDKFASISGSDWTTDTAVNGTVTAVSDVAEIKHTSEAGSYAIMKSVATYKVPFFAVIDFKMDAPIALSLRRLGFANSDWSSGIFFRSNGTTLQLVVKSSGTESTETLIGNWNTYAQYIIHATTTSVKFIQGDSLDKEFTTNIPAGDLYLTAKGEKQ